MLLHLQSALTPNEHGELIDFGYLLQLLLLRQLYCNIWPFGRLNTIEGSPIDDDVSQIHLAQRGQRCGIGEMVRSFGKLAKLSG